MYTAEEREQIIDIVDKMSLLKQDFDGAFTWIKENVSMPFDFDEAPLSSGRGINAH